MDGALVEFYKRVEAVFLKQGEYITVYLKDPDNKFVQIEIRNSKSLGKEIFFDSPDVTVNSFDKWKSCEE